MSEFFHMGGYAEFVWTAYGLSAVALTLLLVRSIRRAKETSAQVEAMRRMRKEAE
jgi:heme exporter protein D